jgi:hypothetical protein
MDGHLQQVVNLDKLHFQSTVFKFDLKFVATRGPKLVADDYDDGDCGGAVRI